MLRLDEERWECMTKILCDINLKSLFSCRDSATAFVFLMILRGDTTGEEQEFY